jgi:hypothetical protein
MPGSPAHLKGVYRRLLSVVIRKSKDNTQDDLPVKLEFGESREFFSPVV